jgi:protoporphyrin/coproporphyrin ferrochelatase
MAGEFLILPCAAKRSGEGDRPKGGGGGELRRLFTSISICGTPTTMLRMVSLPRAAGEDAQANDRSRLDSTPSPREAIAPMDATNTTPARDADTARATNVGVLLVNLGTPDSADTKGVRVYLREFLSDPRVIENQGLYWKLVLNGVILQVRPRRKARDYQKIWNVARNESPLKTITRAQAEKLAAALDGSHIMVDWAMRYGNPSIKAGIDGLMKKGCDRILVVPLYPQYSASTTATVADETLRVLASLRAQPTLRFAPPYFDEPSYIDALAVSIRQHLAALSFTPEVIIASFHGMPQAYIDKGDPYAEHCQATMTALRARLGMDDNKLMLTYQSRFGFDAWLKPYTIDTVADLARRGVKNIAVVTPGFAADCLETLEEIAGENAEVFRHNGGEKFSFIPCLNDSDEGMDVIRQLVMRELQGWI